MWKFFKTIFMCFLNQKNFWGLHATVPGATTVCSSPLLHSYCYVVEEWTYCCRTRYMRFNHVIERIEIIYGNHKFSQFKFSCHLRKLKYFRYNQRPNFAIIINYVDMYAFWFSTEHITGVILLQNIYGASVISGISYKYLYTRIIKYRVFRFKVSESKSFL